MSKATGLAAFLCCLLVTVVVCPPQVQAQGKLNAFEKDVRGPAGAKPEPGEHKGRDEHYHSGDDDWGFGYLLVELFRPCIEVVGMPFVYGGVCSADRVRTGIPRIADVEARKPGEQLIPFVRADAGFQRIGSDIDATDLRGELGYGALGVHLDYTHYREHNPEDGLDLTRIMALYRMSFGSHIETDIGLGVLTVDGDRATSRGLLSLPVLLRVDDNWGFEFRPAWADRFSDYDAALMFTWKYSSVKAGYRWVNSPGESLDGPYVGFSVRL